MSNREEERKVLGDLFEEDKDLTFGKYQRLARKTAVYPNKGANANYAIIGLLGEAGELANKWKKVIRDDAGVITAERRKDMVAEIGDILWYVASLATEIGVDMEDIAQGNLNKLFKRYEKGVLHGDGDNR